MARLLDAVWAWLTRDLTEEGTDRIRELLWVDAVVRPGLPEGAPSWWDEGPQDEALADARSKDARLR